MSQWPNNFNRQPPIIVRPRRRRRRRGFRWSLVIVPGVILLLIWMASGIEVGFSWDELLDDWGVVNKGRFTRLAVLGVVICGIVAVLRVLRGPGQDEDEA